MGEPTPAPSDGPIEQSSLEQVLSAAGSVILASVPKPESDTDEATSEKLPESEDSPISETTPEATSENVETKPVPEATQVPESATSSEPEPNTGLGSGSDDVADSGT